ncbi:MAG TPA: hypothetical protein VN962_28425, partial [Polyangia bacterium]|nr:hypothetical protein [Polyangia bacterium]
MTGGATGGRGGGVSSGGASGGTSATGGAPGTGGLGAGGSAPIGTGGAAGRGTGGTIAPGSGGTGGGSAGSGGHGGAPPSLPGVYVAPDGSDTNPGTMSAPFQTLGKARDVVRTMTANMTQDIVVYLRGGNYPVSSTITFGPSDSGTNGHRVIYQAFPGEVPVLNGATRVTGWSVASGNIYKAALNRTTKLRNLYVNDARATLTSKTATAQGSSGTYAVTSGQAAWAWASGSNADGVKYTAASVPAIAGNKDDLEIVNATTWNENIVCVRDVTTASDGSRVL